MKANELQIGDYVNWRGQIIKVTSLYDKCSSNEVGWGDKEIAWVNADNVESIPLTPEILEKNGFTHSFGDSDFYDYEKWEKKVDDKTIRVIKDHNGWFCRVDDSKLTRSMGIASDVHTMQNIIRIGGIDKTIEL